MQAENSVKEYDFVAIFDADFRPESDFLKKTVPYLVVRLSPHPAWSICKPCIGREHFHLLRFS